MQHTYHPHRVQKVVHYHYHYTDNNFINLSAPITSPISYQHIPQNHVYQQNNINKQSFVNQQYWKTYKNPQINNKYKEISESRGRVFSQSEEGCFNRQQRQRDSNKYCNFIGNNQEIQQKNYKMYKNQSKKCKNYQNQKKIKIKIHPLDKQFVKSQIYKYQLYLDRYKQQNYSSYQNNTNALKINQQNKENYINLRQRTQSTISFTKQSGKQIEDQNILGVSRSNSYLFTERHIKNKPSQQNDQGSQIMNISQIFYQTQTISNKNPQIATPKFFDSKDLFMTAQTNFQSTCQSNINFQQNKNLFTKKSQEFNQMPIYQAKQSNYLNKTSTQSQKENLQYKYNLLKQQCTYLREKIVAHFKNVHKKMF